LNKNLQSSVDMNI